MNICMTGIDFETASIDVRQQFSFTKTEQEEIYKFLLSNPNIYGTVLLVTCNRTELYLSCKDNVEVDAFNALCNACGADFSEFKKYCRNQSGEKNVFRYLSRLACGAQSQIWGEDQIITQVKNSVVSARENKAIDGILEVFFRNAITAAKKIKTDIKFTKSEASVAAQTLDVLQKSENNPKNVLVIGNGEIGRMVTKKLISAGFCVTMTRRSYKHNDVIIPDNSGVLEYSERYEKMHEFDAVVSATSSPHCTVEYENFIKLSHKPSVLVDLAVPRDISTEIAKLDGISLYDVDTLCHDTLQEDHETLIKQADIIIDKYENDFMKWNEYREAAGN